MRRAMAGLLFALGTAPLAAGAADITLSFGDAPGGVASGFRIERREADAKRFEALALVGPGVPEFVDRGLPGGTRYCYRVRALGAQAESAWSPEVCTVAEEEPAAAPVSETAAAEPATGPSAAEAGAAEPGATEAAPAEPAAAEPEREPAAVAETAEPTSAEAAPAETAPAEAPSREPSVAAPAPGGTSEPRRIRASGGWLQVLD